jgi:succinate dehydrogenase / fumarate reductase iron-sulfur subunit
MKLTLKIWRQKNASAKGSFETYLMDDVSPKMAFLEMLDALNKKLVEEDKDPVAFDHDCREGICGSCGMYINGHPHGPVPAITTCHLSMRYFKDGETIWIEPWRAKPFPVIKDLIVDRTAFDKIQIAGGYISVNTGAAPEANSILIQKKKSDAAFDSAICRLRGMCSSLQKCFCYAVCLS